MLDTEFRGASEIQLLSNSNLPSHIRDENLVDMIELRKAVVADLATLLTQNISQKLQISIAS